MARREPGKTRSWSARSLPPGLEFLFQNTSDLLFVPDPEGRMDAEDLARQDGSPMAPLVLKPFAPHQLSRVVRGALGLA